MVLIDKYKMTLDELNRYEFLIVTNALSLFKWGIVATLVGLLLATNIKVGGVLLLVYYSIKLIIELVMNQVGYFNLRYHRKTYREQMTLYSFITATITLYVTWFFFMLNHSQITLFTLLIALSFMLFHAKSLKKTTL